jgi:hypothetical protein
MTNGGRIALHFTAPIPPCANMPVCRIDPTGEFNVRRSGYWSGNRLIRASDLIKKEIRIVHEMTEEKYRKLKLATDVQIGLEILHLFLMDLLGRTTPAAKIFAAKSENEYVLFFPFTPFPDPSPLLSFAQFPTQSCGEQALQVCGLGRGGDAQPLVCVLLDAARPAKRI